MADNKQNPQNTQDIPAVSPNTQDIPAQFATGQTPAQPSRTGQFAAAAPPAASGQTGQIPAQNGAPSQRELLKGKPLPQKGPVVPTHTTAEMPAQPAQPQAAGVAEPTPLAEDKNAAASAGNTIDPPVENVKTAAPEATEATADKTKTAKKKEPAGKRTKAAKGKTKTTASDKSATTDASASSTADKDAQPKRPPKPKGDPEIARIRKEEKNRVARRRNRQLIGFALAILIVVGAISIVRGGVELVSSMLNSDEERLEYQELYEPLVWFDILPFDSISFVDENSIKQVAIWGVLNEKQDQLERNDYGEPLVPVSDIDQYAARIFGPDFRFSVHASFEDPVEDLRYIFNEESQTYTAPVTGLMPRYLATVVEIQRESGGVKRVVMGYVSTLTSDDQVIAAPDYEHPAKYMDFVLRRDGSDYYLYAIQNNTTYTVTAASESLPTEEPAPAPEDELSSSIPAASTPQSEADESTETDSAA